MRWIEVQNLPQLERSADFHSVLITRELVEFLKEKANEGKMCVTTNIAKIAGKYSFVKPENDVKKLQMRIVKALEVGNLIGLKSLHIY